MSLTNKKFAQSIQVPSVYDSTGTGNLVPPSSGTVTIPSGTDTLVTATGSQTLTNKTLTSPSITTPTGITKSDVGLGNVDNTSDATKNSATVTLTNKTITAPVISTIVNTGTLTLPTSTDTLVGRATTDTLTNKTLTSPTINTPSMTSPSVTSGDLSMSGGKVTGLGAPSANGDALRFDQLGANSGIATLDAGGKVPAAQLPSSVMTYEGTWAASTNTPTLANGTGDAGMVYVASDAGTVDFGAGPITFAAGDWVIYSGSIWEKSINSNAVASVNGQTGVVTVNAINQLTGDVTASAASGSESKNTTVAAIAGTTVSGTTGTTNVVFSASPTLTGTITAASATFSGSVGIDTTSPSYDLTVGDGTTARTIGSNRSTSNDFGADLTIQGSGAKSGATDSNPGILTISSGPSTGRGTEAPAIVFSAPLDDGATGTTDKPATEKMKITSYGNVTIGDPSIDSFFYVETFDGFVGIGMSGSQGEVPTAQLSFGEGANSTIIPNRRITSNLAGRNLTVQGGGATTGATNKAGGSLILKPGISTGTGNSTVLISTRALGTSGTSDSPGSELVRLTVDQRGDVIIGNNTSPLNASATGGFLQINKMSGAPSGTPTVSASSAPVTIDSLNDNFYFYTNSAWHAAGTVTSVATGTGLTGGPITSSGTISLADTAVTPASYGTTAAKTASFTVDQQGRLTAASEQDIAIAASQITSGTLPIARGGTNSTTALNNNRIMTSSGGAIVEAAALTNGQLLIGSTGAAPVAAAITAGTGITITNGAGSITIASTSAGSPGDIGETSFSGANNQASPVNVTGLAFANGTVRSFNALVSIYIATIGNVGDLYEVFELRGVQKGSSWDLSYDSVGDTSGITFSITTSGQIQYTSTNVTLFSSNTTKFRAITTSV